MRGGGLSLKTAERTPPPTTRKSRGSWNSATSGSAEGRPAVPGQVGKHLGVALDVELHAARRGAEPERLERVVRGGGEEHRVGRERDDLVAVPLEHVWRERDRGEDRVGVGDVAT